VKDMFRVGGDRRKVILEEAGTQASCVPYLTSFNYLIIYLFYFKFIFIFIYFLFIMY
jgi:hypothetical protein